MGFADKFSSGLLPSKKKRAATFPDTEFGTRVPPRGGAAQSGDGDEASPLRIGNLFGRKREDGEGPEESAIDTPLPLIGHLSLPRQLRVLLMVMAFGILMTLVSLWRNAASSAVTSGLTQVASDALMHSQRIGKAAPNAVRGNVAAFTQLEDSRRRLDEDLKLLTSGGTFDGRSLPAPGGRAALMVKDVRKKWTATFNAASTILSHKTKLTNLDQSLQQIGKQSPEMTKLLEAVLENRVAAGASAREVAQLGRLMMVTQRISKNATDFVTASVVRSSETAFDLGRDIETMRRGLESLDGVEGDALRQRFVLYKEAVDVVLGNLTDFTRAKGAEQSIFYENEELKALLTAVQERMRDDQESTALWFWLMVASGVFTLATAGGVSRVLLQDSRNRTRGAEMRRQEAEEMRARAQAKEEEAKATNDQNQAAILRLMNELQEVADGDLTVHATVSEDITGAIADSVNYTVEELRGLVGRVTRTAEQVTTASNNAQKISTDLLVAAKQQSREIENASATVLRMASEITDVSRSASRSADVARQSVAAASQGSNAVEKTILGMQEIRDQIQETSKRIKRLGESSQEIGEITALISDITEQTNVLALNAAIQAASAGEAGRGFSVVAEEVQRLAERSGEAAKQIGALVRTIQTDTHDAVAAMEQSTQGVVEGAKLSDAAGAALAEISRVSNQLAELIQEISYATGRQATSANGVANDMGHILTITQNTQKGTQQTVLSIRQLSLLAQELKNSVARFRVA